MPRFVRYFAASVCVNVAAAASATPPVFPIDNPWNQRITNAPVHAASNAVMNSIITTFGNGRFHPDFGQDYQNSSALYGIPYNIVHGSGMTPVSVVINAYASQSDIVPAPIPEGAVLEGELQNGPVVGVNTRGDSHLLVWDVDANIAYEFYRASRPSENADGRWHADAEAVWNFGANSFRPLGWTSADAANLSILAGLVRPDEGLPVSSGGGGGAGVITHAMRFTLTNSVILNKFIYPAAHTANPGNTNAAIQPPMGSRFRLKASVDTSTLNPQSRVIAQALKDYGMILADNGSNFFISGASYSPSATNGVGLTWSDADIQDTVHGLKSLHFADFEMVDLTPIVSGVSPGQASPGAQALITGANFGGAAGRLQVLFGSTAATSVTVVDDSHVTATVPAGSGTVDVRAQSGLTQANSQNINNPIFGYGISAVVLGDRFTYGAAQGVCCRGATCSATVTQASCTPSGAAGALFVAGTAVCNGAGNAAAPCCFSDYNKTGGVSVQDVFDYLRDWFAASPLARVGGDGTGAAPGVQSVFDFLGAWFTGCP